MELIDPNNYEDKKPKLKSGVIIGHTTPTTAKIWFRVYREAIWWLVLSERPFKGDMIGLNSLQVDEYFNSIDYPIAYSTNYEFLENEGLVHTFEVGDLKENTRYYYALIADRAYMQEIPRRTEIGSNNENWFNTMPLDNMNVRFGYYSCHDPFSRADYGEGMWPSFYQLLKEKQANFAVGGGDQVYVDTNKASDMKDIWQWLKENKVALVDKYSNGAGQLNEAEIKDYLVKIYRNYYRIYWRKINLLNVYARFPQYMTFQHSGIRSLEFT